MRKMVLIFTITALVCTWGFLSAATPSSYTGHVFIESKQVLPGASFTAKVWLQGNNSSLTSLRIPIKLASSNLTCNYVDFTGSIKSAEMEGYSRINGNEIEISFVPSVVSPVPAITTDSGLIATLYLTASASAPDGFIAIDSANSFAIVWQEAASKKIWHRVEIADGSGSVTLLPDFSAGSIQVRRSTDIATGDEDMLPKTMELGQNFPNPFNPSTSIVFALPSRAHVRLEIYNLLGQTVATLADGEFGAGNHALVWDASNSPSGIYFYRLSVGKDVLTKKMLLMK